VLKMAVFIYWVVLWYLVFGIAVFSIWYLVYQPNSFYLLGGK
jgi:hypothetical protein